MRFIAGARLGNYEIVGPLGAGGMGEVYLARDTRLEREVALKVLPSRMKHDAESIARFRREALTLASLNHPNLATVHGFEEDPDGTLVLVLERVEGVSLAERLRGGALPVEEALQVCAQVAQALEVAHERGVIHRDVKPGNLMIGPRGLVKVLDFGLARRIAALRGADAPAMPAPDEVAPADRARALDADLENDDTLVLDRAAAEGSAGVTGTMSGMTVGTPGYMAPEQVQGLEVNERSDVFALGCVLFECLTGRRAFSGANAALAMRAALETTPDLTGLPERTSARVRSLIERCLAKSSAGRPESMRAVRVELEEALGIRRASALREGGAIAVHHNLPAPATSFIGRQAVLAACESALDRARLLTLLGMGGSGKTRLALRLAKIRLAAFPDGVAFVDVAPLAGPDRLVDALAAANGVHDEPGRTLDQVLTQSLATKRALVVFDNAETHLQACARLTDHLLSACADLKVLVTSREPLGLTSETALTIPGLGTPDAAVGTAAKAAAFDSVRLFTERAAAARPDFELTDRNAAAVAEICRRLDGLPLAIELAAARVRLLDAEQIRARLDDRFRLLTRAGTGAPTRQQTMLAVIQWSWDQLLEPEQLLMRRLAVFSGSWTLERATRVCSDQGDEFEVLDLLTRLVERSLVVVEHGEDAITRYRFLESVWRFALERFEQDAEHVALRDRHLAAYVDLAERAERAMIGSDVAATVRDLAAEEDNLIAAASWCDHAEDGVELGLRLVSSASRMWSMLGRFTLGRRLIEQALARDSERRPTALRAKTLVRLAGFAINLGDYDGCRPALEESLVISTAIGDRKGEARSLGGLGVVAMVRSRLEDAAVLSEQSRELYERLGERRGVAMALHNLGSIDWALRRGDHGRARFEAALPILREGGDHVTAALCLAALAATLVRLGELDEAAARLHECLATLESLEAPREGVYAIEAIAEWLAARNQSGEAARMLGAAAALRVAIAMPASPHEQVEIDRLRDDIAARIGKPDLDRFQDAGRTLSLDRAMVLAKSLIV